MNETIEAGQFDSSKLMGKAKELFDAMPNLLAELDKHHGEVPQVDKQVAAVKAELMRINAGGTPGQDADKMMSLLEKFSKQTFTADFNPNIPRNQTRAHMAAPEEPAIDVVNKLNSQYSAQRYGG